jgi:hypothetical protein
MRRAALILLLLFIGWLGKNRMKTAVQQQQYLLWLLLAQTMVAKGVSSSAPKALAVESRLNLLIPAIGTMNTSINSVTTQSNSLNSAIGGNKTFLGTLSFQSTAPTKAGTDGDSLQGAAGTTYSQGTAQATINRVNNLITYVNAFAADFNQLIDALGVAGVGLW